MHLAHREILQKRPASFARYAKPIFFWALRAAIPPANHGGPLPRSAKSHCSSSYATLGLFSTASAPSLKQSAGSSYSLMSCSRSFWGSGRR